MNWLVNARIKNKLFMITGLAIAGILVVMITSALSLRSTLAHEKELKTRHLVEVALGTLTHYHQLFREGTLSEKEAQAAAVATITRAAAAMPRRPPVDRGNRVMGESLAPIAPWCSRGEALALSGSGC
jgi:hypothetical protein